VGIRNLLAAAKAANVALDYEWQPFILNRHIPPSGVGYKQYLEAVYGPRDFSASRQHLRDAGSAVGIKFNFDEERLIFPTVRSHALVEYCRERGKSNDIMDVLFQQYFEEGKSLYDVDNLVTAACKVGLGEQEPEIRQYLLDEKNLASVLEREASFKRQYPNCHGVPYFVFPARPREITVSGAQPIPTFVKLLSTLEPPLDLASETRESLSERSVRELRTLAAEVGIAATGFVEKAEFVEALVDRQRKKDAAVCDPNDPSSCM
jgi:predicted DsbA family dithiol-disulfide isomerase